MTTQQVADKVVQLCSQGKFNEAYSLYSPDIVSVEAGAPPGQSRESKGIDAIKAKGEWWTANHDVHSAKVEGPLVAGSHFSVKYVMDVTFKPQNRRFTMEEIGMYKVQDGKIVHEEFFYSMYLSFQSFGISMRARHLRRDLTSSQSGWRAHRRPARRAAEYFSRPSRSNAKTVGPHRWGDIRFLAGLDHRSAARATKIYAKSRRPLGSGIGRPSSRTVSIHSSITSSAFASASCLLAPSAAQPASSGTSAMNAWSSSLQ